MDFSRLNTGRVLVGAIASLAADRQRSCSCPGTRSTDEPRRGLEQPDDLDLRQRRASAAPASRPSRSCAGCCSLAALAPLILAYILVRGHKLSCPPGEMTMIAGFAAAVLIVYNGIIDKPGSGPAEIGVSLDYGYWIALLCAIVIAGVGFTRSVESGRGARPARPRAPSDSHEPATHERDLARPALGHEARPQPRARAGPGDRGGRARRRALGRQGREGVAPTAPPSTRCACCSTPCRWTASS